MSDFDNEYYILFPMSSDTQFVLQPDERTEDRRYSHEKLTRPIPLYFKNAFADQDTQTGVKRQLTSIMPDASSFAVCNEIKEHLSQFDIEGMQLHPSIFIDDEDTWHEGYWYLNFYENLDCWDRDKSTYKTYGKRLNSPALIKKFVLRDDVLSAIPEEKRLIFRMGNSRTGRIFVHKTIARYLLENAYSGFKLIKTADFKEGDQYD